MIEGLAIRTGIPIGGLWLIILMGGGLVYISSKPPMSEQMQQDYIIGAAMWAIGYAALWFGYKDRFWMSANALKAIRNAKYNTSQCDDDD